MSDALRRAATFLLNAIDHGTLKNVQAEAECVRAVLAETSATSPAAWMVVNADGALSLFDNEDEARQHAEWAHGPRPVHPLYTLKG